MQILFENLGGRLQNFTVQGGGHEKLLTYSTLKMHVNIIEFSDCRVLQQAFAAATNNFGTEIYTYLIANSIVIKQ